MYDDTNRVRRAGEEDLFGPARVRARVRDASETTIDFARPNPFRGESEFRFVVPVAGEVSVSIYDVVGRLVRELATGDLPAGEHSLRWNARDDGGSLMPAGLYFVQLRIGTEIETRKIVHLGSP